LCRRLLLDSLDLETNSQRLPAQRKDVAVSIPRMRGIVPLLGLMALLPFSAMAIGDASTFSQQTLDRDLPMPKPSVPTDDPAFCDDIGHAVSWQMLTEAGWDNIAYLGACLARPVPGSTGGLRMHAACRALTPTDSGDAAVVPCRVLFVNNGLGTWRISPTQFELRETSGRPHRAVAGPGASELVLTPDESGTMDVSFETDTGMTEPFFVVWWPDERLPPGSPQSLTIAVGV
jgi:hypothetical protein